MEVINVIGKYLQSGRAWYNRNVSGINFITVHHDAFPHTIGRTNEQSMQLIYNTHVKNGWPGFSYQYFIGTDGKIYQVNQHGWVTWHDSHNWDSIGIVLTGYFHSPHNNKPTSAQLQSLAWLLNKLSTEHPEFPATFKDIRGHRERQATACPGDLLFPYVKEFREKSGKVSWGNPGDNMDFIDLKKRLSDKHWSELTEFEDLRKKGLIDRADSIQTQTQKWLKSDSALRAEVNILIDLKKKAENEAEGLKTQLSKAVEQAGKVEARARELEVKIVELERDLKGQDNTIEDLHDKIVALEVNNTKLQTDLNNCRANKDGIFEQFISYLKELWQK